MHSGFKNQYTKSVSVTHSEGQRNQTKKKYAIVPLSTELVVFSNTIHSFLVNYTLS